MVHSIWKKKIKKGQTVPNLEEKCLVVNLTFSLAFDQFKSFTLTTLVN